MNIKNHFTCSQCSHKTIKWIGCCPSCHAWDSFVQEEQALTPKGKRLQATKSLSLVHLDEVTITNQQRMLAGIDEWDRVLGGGIVPGSLLILTGDPGIGKSTLLLQVANRLAEQYVVHYVSTEESLQQVSLRARRLTCKATNLLFSDDADLDTIIANTREQKPAILIIDSIQNCYSQSIDYAHGSISQLREATFQLMRLAKDSTIAILLSGHITKEGTIAGPKTLEHMVDAVFYLQGEDRWQTRILRAVKNRFGTVNELGFFEMHASGLEQVSNINEHLLNDFNPAPGSVLISFIEGSRPLLLELQALTIESKLGFPQRVVSGVDQKQVVLIAAILEKYLHIRLSSHDIFFKVSSGFKVKESATDLGIAIALLSSYFQQPLPQKAIALGEINLTGQIQPINQINTLMREAEKFGIEQILVAKGQKMESTKCHIKRFSNVYELLSLFKEP